MKTTTRLSSLGAAVSLVLLGAFTNLANAQTWTTIDDPASIGSTKAYGISGSDIVGSWTDTTGFVHGFLYNGATFTTMDDPSGAAAHYSHPYAISGANTVGVYYDSNNKAHGYLYNGMTYSTLNDPLGVDGARATGISGSDVVGYYQDSNGSNFGFLYNGSSYTALTDPSSSYSAGGTQAFGIDGANIVGDYDGEYGSYSFLYNGATWTMLNDSSGIGTTAYAISGKYIVGIYYDFSYYVHGFMYDGTTYTTLDDPLGSPADGGTWPFGIDGNKIVGYYVDSSRKSHGFVYTLAASGIPAAPTGLTASPGNAAVTLTWTASAGATSYSLYSGTTAGGEKSTPFATGVKSTRYSNTHLTNGKTYYYKVAAVNSGGTSGYSNEAWATPEAPPTAPTNLTATAGNAEVTLKWTASSGATSYDLYSGTTAGGEKAKPFATGVKSTHYLNTHLTNGATYYFKVVAVNAVGTSGYSNEASATPVLAGASVSAASTCLVAAALLDSEEFGTIGVFKDRNSGSVRNIANCRRMRNTMKSYGRV